MGNVIENLALKDEQAEYLFSSVSISGALQDSPKSFTISANNGRCSACCRKFPITGPKAKPTMPSGDDKQGRVQ